MAQRVVQGGSTLTQQLVKNLYLTHERTMLRKMNEMLMAVSLERQYSKEKIIETYAAATQHVDQGLSLTLFFKDTATTRDVRKLFEREWSENLVFHVNELGDLEFHVGSISKIKGDRHLFFLHNHFLFEAPPLSQSLRVPTRSKSKVLFQEKVPVPFFTLTLRVALLQ
mgnify:CR=1 FL=1